MDYKKEIQNIWELALPLIGSSYSETTFNLWFADIQPIDMTENKFIVCTTSAFKRNIISSKHRDVIEEALKEVIGYYIELAILTKDEAERYSQSGSIPTFEENEEKKQDKPLPSVIPLTDYTFDNFIVGASNTFAHAAAQAVANSPATAYNPLYIWGPPGIGKTHLIYAIKNHLSKNSPELSCIYVKGEDFTNQVVDAIMKQNTHAFREKYRKVDVLFIDDIQFIAGKTSTQEEFSILSTVFLLRISR